jgi:hypothetical protein
MCAVCVLYAYAQKIPLELWTPQRLDAFKKTLQPTMDFDQLMGEPDCADPEKKAWLERVERAVDPSPGA